jgi:hypothetical protein
MSSKRWIPDQVRPSRRNANAERLSFFVSAFDISQRSAYLDGAAMKDRLLGRSFCFFCADVSWDPRVGDIMAKKSKRRTWTRDDIRDLKNGARQKTPARKIARSLKRTEGATRQKAFSLGISLDSRS